MSDGAHEKPPAERVREFVDRYHSRADEFVLYVLDEQHGRTPCDRWATAELAPVDVFEATEARALQHSNVLGGVHVYALEAQQEGRALGHELLRVSAEAMPGAGVSTEPPNEAGLVAQLMRHNEAVQRIASTSADRLARSSHRIVESATKRAADAEARAMQLFDQVAERRTADMRIEAELANSQANAELKRKFGEQLTALLPQAVGKVVGKAGDSNLGNVMALKGFLSTITREQMAAILQNLHPAQQAALLDLYQSMQQDDAEQPAKEGEGAH